MNKELIDFIDKPVDVKKLVDHLFFSLDDLEHAALKQPRLRLEAGRFRAQVGLEAMSLRRKLARVIGKKSLRLRRSGDYKTEGAVKNKLALDDKVQSIQKLFDTAEVYSEFAHDLVEAYKERSMAVSVLTRLRSAEISSQLASARGEDEVDRLRKKARKVRDDYDRMGEQE